MAKTIRDIMWLGSFVLSITFLFNISGLMATSSVIIFAFGWIFGTVLARHYLIPQFKSLFMRKKE